jgi:hypothetical protein
MKVCFEWKDISIFRKSAAAERLYLNNKSAAYATVNYTDGDKYSGYIYLDGGYDFRSSSGKGLAFKTLDDAKNWCDKELEKNGVKILGEEYRVLL